MPRDTLRSIKSTAIEMPDTIATADERARIKSPPALCSRRERIDLRRLKVPRQCAHFVLQTQGSDSEVLIEAEPRERRAESYANGTEQAQT